MAILERKTSIIFLFCCILVKTKKRMLGRDVKVHPVFVRLFRLLMLNFHF